jgi:hypothetical protein
MPERKKQAPAREEGSGVDPDNFNLERFVGGGSLRTDRHDAHHFSSGGLTVRKPR